MFKKLRSVSISFRCLHEGVTVIRERSGVDHGWKRLSLAEVSQYSHPQIPISYSKSEGAANTWRPHERDCGLVASRWLSPVNSGVPIYGVGTCLASHPAWALLTCSLQGSPLTEAGRLFLSDTRLLGAGQPPSPAPGTRSP